MNSLIVTHHNTGKARAGSHAVVDATYHEELLRISRMRTGAYETHEHVIRLPLDGSMISETKHMAERYYSSTLRYVVVVGIGGSNLGAKAVYDALRGSLDLASPIEPKILFLDTVSTHLLHSIAELLHANVTHADQVLINLVSKSGSTTESIANFELLMHTMRERIPDIHTRVVVTSDQGSPLWELGKAHGYGLLAIPKMVGGRYSVFSTVGLFPLMLAGIDVVELCEGAKSILESLEPNAPMGNRSKRAAEELFGYHRSGCSLLNLFFFNPELESLGKWERQLVGESLGKEKDKSGKQVHAGITPIVSIGSTDLHSMAQLYFGGPRDKYTMLVRAHEVTSRKIGTEPILPGLIKHLESKSPADIMEAIYSGVMDAYTSNELPFVEVRMSRLSAYTLGMYLEWRILTTIYLAHLMHVDPFDQPNVEDYKKGTRERLALQTK